MIKNKNELRSPNSWNLIFQYNIHGKYTIIYIAITQIEVTNPIVNIQHLEKVMKSGIKHY